MPIPTAPTPSTGVRQYGCVEQSLRFVVHGAFTLTGRGTVAWGHIESGEVRLGDALTLFHGDEQRTVTCTGIAPLKMRTWKQGDPAPIGLMLPALQPEDLASGDVLVSAPRS